jgi:hypothetical protein
MFHLEEHFESGTFNPTALKLYKINNEEFNRKCNETVEKNKMK